MFYVYILYSHSTSKHYIGQTNNLQNRIERHNNGESISTKSGLPWELLYFCEVATRPEAIKLELKIKKRGAKRFLEDIK